MSLLPSDPSSPSSTMQVIPPSTSPSSPFFLIFFASVDEKTGQSWCPDCVRAQDTIEANVPSNRSSLIPVGSRAEWRDSNNPFRQAFKLTNLPTIVRVESTPGNDAQDVIASAPRLIEGELLDEDKFKQFLKV